MFEVDVKKKGRSEGDQLGFGALMGMPIYMYMSTHYIHGHKYVSVRSSYPRIHSALL